MLRHACGYALANAGHDTRALQAWLGHKNIQHTVRYTELAPDRFKNGGTEPHLFPDRPRMARVRRFGKMIVAGIAACL
jgi:integrase